MESLKILMFNWRCWLNPDSGGAEVFTRENLKRIANMGNEVVLFTSRFDKSAREEVSDGVKIVRDGGKYSVYWKARKHYKKRFSKEKFDVVIDQINTIPFFTPKFVKTGETIIALIHQLAREYWFYETRFPVNYLGYNFFEERWLRNYVDTPTFTVSESTKQNLTNLGFKNISIVSEGLNFEPLKTTPRKEDFPALIYCGRLKRAKRPDHAIKALEIVKREIPDAELWIVGSGYFETSLRKMAADGVKFFGNLPCEARRELIKKAWILIHPSIREGFGLNIVEANALGTPCMAYNVPGLRDAVINGETGVLVENGDVKTLSEETIKLLKDQRLRRKMSVNAIKHSKQYSWDTSAQQIMTLIKNTINAQNA